MPVRVGAILSELRRFRPGAPRKYGKNLAQVTPARKIQIKSFEEANAAGINSVTFRGVAEGQFKSNAVRKGPKATSIPPPKFHDYRVAIQFFEVKFSDKKSKFFSEIVTVGGKVKFREVPNVKSNSVKLKCSCPDFRFRFEKELFDHKGLIGRFQKYTRKTPPPPEGHAFANPDELMGYCKHIHIFLKRLKANEKIKG